jgi:hypothetical protein
MEICINNIQFVQGISFKNLVDGDESYILEGASITMKPAFLRGDRLLWLVVFVSFRSLSCWA